jgi:hypothetical protein
MDDEKQIVEIGATQRIPTIAPVENPSPEYLIQIGMMQGANLQELIAMRERLVAEQARNAYYKAMAAFKQGVAVLVKDKKVEFKTSKGVTSYSHASLGGVVQETMPVMAKHGLSASWLVDTEKQIKVTCRISHEGGHVEETSMSAPAETSGTKNNIQAMGSTVTYLERYTFLALTGLATKDQDTDAEPFISEEQIKKIDQLVKATKPDWDAFLKFAGADSIDQILEKDYARILGGLKAKERALKQPAKKAKEPDLEPPQGMTEEEKEYARLRDIYEAADETKLGIARVNAKLKADGPIPDSLAILKKVISNLA